MQRYFAEDKNNNSLILKKEDLHHIKNVMRSKIGDKIECIYNQKLYICEIINPDSNEVKIITEEKETNELNIDLTIAIALVKEQKMDIILQKLTELGVNRIIPLKMERSIVKLEESKITKKQIRWTTICKEASEQSKRNLIPIVEKPITIDELTKENYDIRLICSTNKEKNLYKVLKGKKLMNKKILCIIGPEGGITPKEEEFLKAANMTPVSLGNRIMRVETAAIYIASIINFLSQEVL